MTSARMLHAILTVAAVFFAIVGILFLHFFEQIEQIVQTTSIFYVVLCLIGVAFILLLFGGLPLIFCVWLLCILNDRKSVSEILHGKSFKIVGGICLSPVLIISILGTLLKDFQIVAKITYWMYFAIMMSVMLYSHIRSAYWYIQYMKIGFVRECKPDLSNSGFICLRDFSLFIVLLSFYALCGGDNFIPYAYTAMCILIGFYVIGNALNLILYYKAKKLYGIITYRYDDEWNLDDGAIGKPVLITADALVWDVDEAVMITLLNGSLKHFKAHSTCYPWSMVDDQHPQSITFFDGYSQSFTADGIFIPEFAVDIVMGYYYNDINQSCEDIIKFEDKDITIINAFSYADACRQMLNQDRGKNGIIVLSHTDLQMKKLRALLTPEELEKIKFVSVGYTDLVAPR